MSTGSVKQLIRLGTDLKANGHRLIDAPVGRSKIEAASGNLLVMVGGECNDVKEANNIFKAVDDQVEHVGPLGFGLKVKLVNNYMTMVNSVLTGEVLSFAHLFRSALGVPQVLVNLELPPWKQGSRCVNQLLP